MALKHDAQGFLAGDPIDIGQALATWGQIRQDVQAIRRAVVGGMMGAQGDAAHVGASRVPAKAPSLPARAGSNSMQRISVSVLPGPASRMPAVPRGRDGRGRFIKTAPQALARPVAQSPATLTTPAAPAASPLTPIPSSAVLPLPGASGRTPRQVAAEEESDQPQQSPQHPLQGIRQKSTDSDAPGGRDRRGRFIKGAEPNPDGTPNAGPGAGSPSEGVFRGFLGRLTDAVSGAGDTLENADPAVKAFQEVAQPLTRGYGMLTGGGGGSREDKRKDGWFRRIYGSLSGFRKDESAFNKVANKSLKNLEDKPGGDGGRAGGGSGILSMLGGVIPRILGGILPMLGMLFMRILLPIAGVIAAWNVGQWIGEKIYAWMDKAGINTIIFDAFDGAKKFITEGWTSVTSTFGTVADGISKAWSTIIALFVAAYNALKSLPVIGPAIKAAEELAKKAKDKVVEVAAPVIVVAKDTAEKAKEKVIAAVAPVTAAVKDAAAGAKQGYTGQSQAGAGRGSINPPMAGSTEPLDTRSMAFKAGEVVGGAAGFAGNTANRAYNVTAAAAGSVLEAAMPKGYRHKALFDGIKGGDGLTKYGSYTDEEAAKIRQLKTSGANTSANVKGGMSLEIQDKISSQAKKAGLDPVMMQKIAAMESGGNANAVSSTGATGIYQFTGQTASGVGIKDRFDADQNIEGGMNLTRQNSESLQKSGLSASAENLYMMHQLGPKAAKEVIQGAKSGKLKSDMSPETQKAMNLNYGANSSTAADYVGTNKKALEDRYAAVTKDTGGTQAAIAKAGAVVPAASVQTASAGPVMPAGAHSSASVATISGSPGPSVPAAVAAPVQSAFVAAPKVPTFALPPAIAEAPPVINPLSSGADSKKPITVSLPAQDVGQDLRERRFAHIVTGGFSGG